MTEDNWKHRSVGMVCGTCMWFAEKVPDIKGNPRVAVKFGRCRRRAPTMSGYPGVYGTDWCGDHKLNENYVGE